MQGLGFGLGCRIDGLSCLKSLSCNARSHRHVSLPGLKLLLVHTINQGLCVAEADVHQSRKTLSRRKACFLLSTVDAENHWIWGQALGLNERLLGVRFRVSGV